MTGIGISVFSFFMFQKIFTRKFQTVLKHKNPKYSDNEGSKTGRVSLHKRVERHDETVVADTTVHVSDKTLNLNETEKTFCGDQMTNVLDKLLLNRPKLIQPVIAKERVEKGYVFSLVASRI